MCCVCLNDPVDLRQVKTSGRHVRAQQHARAGGPGHENSIYKLKFTFLQ